jgi:hypothetical protein
MTITTATMMVGPGKMRWAPFGTDDALIVAAFTPNWTGWSDVGSTDGGINLSIAKSYANHTVDQSPDWVASTITERHFSVQTNVVESGDLSKLSLVNNGGLTLSTNPSWTSYQPTTDLISKQETYIAVAIEGVKLNGKSQIIVVRKVLNVDSVNFDFKKDAKTMLALSFAGHFVTDAIAPFIEYSQN